MLPEYAPLIRTRDETVIRPGYTTYRTGAHRKWQLEESVSPAPTSRPDQLEVHWLREILTRLRIADQRDGVRQEVVRQRRVLPVLCGECVEGDPLGFGLLLFDRHQDLAPRPWADLQGRALCGSTTLHGLVSHRRAQGLRGDLLLLPSWSRVEEMSFLASLRWNP